MTIGGLINYLMSRNLCFDSSLIPEIIGQWKLTGGMWAIDGFCLAAFSPLRLPCPILAHRF
ncbi:hypothetical protein [Neochlamydia sp. AcF95]|uniref:hypothetical protein n=1 Tax=Neochlamydia sp. AcF95 TaxID=2795734 RepID=UPI001BCA08C9|nr:hypothetical protein [Neochlamydia sp. AcF95]MBS4171438.1 hypothetical protein [Neochlamydia sp. AcF95]